jgi:hypothetical protein
MCHCFFQTKAVIAEHNKNELVASAIVVVETEAIRVRHRHHTKIRFCCSDRFIRFALAQRRRARTAPNRSRTNTRARVGDLFQVRKLEKKQNKTKQKQQHLWFSPIGAAPTPRSWPKNNRCSWQSTHCSRCATDTHLFGVVLTTSICRQEVKHVADDLVNARSALAAAKQTDQWGPLHEFMSTQANFGSAPTASHSGGGSSGGGWQSSSAPPPSVPPRSLPHVPLDACANRAMQVHMRADDTRQLRDFALLQQVEPFAVAPSRAASAPQFAQMQRATPQKFEHARCQMQILDEAVRVSQHYLAHGAAAFQSQQAFEQQRDQHRRLQQALRASRVVVRESMTALNLGVSGSGGAAGPAANDNDEQLRLLYTELGMEQEGNDDDYDVLSISPAPAPVRALSPSPMRPMSPTNAQRPLSPRHGQLPTSSTPSQRPMSPNLAQSPPRMQHRPTSPAMPTQRRQPVDDLHRSAPLVSLVQQQQQQQQQQSPIKKLTSAPKPAHLPLPKFEATALPDVPTSPRGNTLTSQPRAHAATVASMSPGRVATPVAAAPELSNYTQLAMSQPPMAVETDLDRFRVARMSMGPKSATLFRVEAQWAFDNGGNHRKLSFAKGERLDVVSVVSDAWFHAVNQAGIEGLIPANRVQKL